MPAIFNVLKDSVHQCYCNVIVNVLTVNNYDHDIMLPVSEGRGLFLLNNSIFMPFNFLVDLNPPTHFCVLTR